MSENSYNEHHYKHQGEMMSILASHCFLCQVNELQEENALLTKKNKGLEDIDEDKANLRDIAQRAINFMSREHYSIWDIKDLQAALDAELKPTTEKKK